MEFLLDRIGLNGWGSDFAFNSDLATTTNQGAFTINQALPRFMWESTPMIQKMGIFGNLHNKVINHNKNWQLSQFVKLENPFAVAAHK